MLKGSHSFQNSPPRDIDDALILTTIQVMVVDHKKDFLGYVGDLLRSYAFEVTCVDHAGDALRILSESKDKFDLLLIDSELRDVDILTFLRLTKAMHNGASLVFKRPLTDDELKKARQQVLKDRIHKYYMLPDETSSYIDPRLMNGNYYYYVENENDADFAKKKVCLEWTEELHTKFLDAVYELGEGRCFPKDILETMGVPGLTRMQIASHLQKCRRDGWKFIGKRAPSSSKNTMTFSRSQESVDSRRFGRMPCVAPNSANQEEIISQYDAPPSFPNIGRQMDVNYMNNQPFTDPSHVNGFGSFRNNGEVFVGPSAGQGSIFPPIPGTSEILEMMKDFNANNLCIPYADLNVSGLNNSIVSEPDYSQGMPNQGAQVFNRSL
ncbi:hypothetical protein L6452_15325 [Arctium lappa]|uniref:Uncharacterized protein n=1 Tax=Arctium lappa TaxID=4217 RepID=A0ACB9CNJ7_ARCLA|nr:hypothetical protein L6452_15325 [Arctium lappa]